MRFFPTSVRGVLAAIAAVAATAFLAVSVGADAQTPVVKGVAPGDMAGMKAALETKLGTTIDTITKMPAAGLYEITSGEDVFYTDATGNYLVVGNLIDLRSKENLTRKRAEAIKEASLPKFNFADLPLDSAVKIVKGNGKRQVAIFEDPHCGYCKKLEASLKEISDVTIYVFLFPVLGPDSLAKSKQIWCAPNRTKAWTDWMENGTAPTGEGACKTPLDSTLALGKKLKVDGTPTMFFGNNKRVEGAIGQADLEKALAAS